MTYRRNSMKMKNKSRNWPGLGQETGQVNRHGKHFYYEPSQLQKGEC